MAAQEEETVTAASADEPKDGLAQAIEMLEEAGFDVGASLRGWFWMDPALVEVEGEIGEDYCWSHTPGGWICQACQAERREEEQRHGSNGD